MWLRLKELSSHKAEEPHTHTHTHTHTHAHTHMLVFMVYGDSP